MPTAAESGNKGYEAYAWTGVFFPAKVPAAIVQRVGDQVRAVMSSAEGATFIGNLGGAVFTGSAQQLRDFQLAEIEATKRVVKSANIPIE
ncbi:Tripartite tricarboxylate transporter family receptor [compost metagenome]